MTLIFFSVADSFARFHRRPFVENVAKALSARGGSTIYFTQPRWLLSRKRRPAEKSSALVTVKPLYILLPLSLCLRLPWLIFLCVSLPIQIQLAWHLRKTARYDRRVAWVYKPDQYLYLKALGLPYVYDHYDNYEASEGYAFLNSPLYQKSFEACLDNSALNIAPSHKTIEKFSAFANYEYISSAVDEALVLKPVQLKLPDTTTRPVIGYVGTIDHTIDAQLIADVCEAFPNADIHLIGPSSREDIDLLATQYSNLHMLGRVPYESLPEYLTQFSVAICPYADTEYNRYRNPLKLYEYCAFGLPAVASSCDFDPEGRELVTIVDQHQDFVAAITQALADNNLSKAHARLAFAAKNTWTTKAAQVLALIDQSVPDGFSVFEALVEKTSIYQSPEHALNAINEKLIEAQGVNIGFVNAHAYNVASKKTEFAADLSACDVLLRDGIGVKFWYQIIKRDPGYNLNGTDFIPQLLSTCFSGKNIAVLGASEQELSAACPQIASMGLNVVYSAHGFHPCSEYLELLQGIDVDVDVVLLAMGMPKQERVAALLRQHHPNISVINGGAIVDFLAGKVSRAPMWMRRLGMEWCYRLVLEPRRLFKRYVIGNVLFMARALMFKRSGANTCEL